MLQYATGIQHWYPADAAGTQYYIACGFRPKAMRFNHNNAYNSSDGWQISHIRQSIGFAVESGLGGQAGTVTQRCFHRMDRYNEAIQVCLNGFGNDCVAMTVLGTPARTGLLSVSDVGPAGFTLRVDLMQATQASGQSIIWEAWGDDEGFAQAELIDITESDGGAGGAQFFYPLGFQADALMFASNGYTTAQGVNNTARGNSAISIGFATPGSSVCVAGASTDNVSTASQTAGVAYNNLCIAHIGGDSQLFTYAGLYTIASNGFTLTWVKNTTLTNRRCAVLAIKGGKWVAGSHTLNGSVNGSTQVINTPAPQWQPAGISMLTAGRVAGAVTVTDRIGIGAGNSTSNQKAIGSLSSHNVATSATYQSIEHDCVLTYPGASATAGKYAISAMGATSLTIQSTGTTGIASDQHVWLLFGNLPPITATSALTHSGATLSSVAEYATPDRVITSAALLHSSATITATALRFIPARSATIALTYDAMTFGVNMYFQPAEAYIESCYLVHSGATLTATAARTVPTFTITAAALTHSRARLAATAISALIPTALATGLLEHSGATFTAIATAAPPNRFASVALVHLGKQIIAAAINAVPAFAAYSVPLTHSGAILTASAGSVPPEFKAGRITLVHSGAVFISAASRTVPIFEATSATLVHSGAAFTAAAFYATFHIGTTALVHPGASLTAAASRALPVFNVTSAAFKHTGATFTASALRAVPSFDIVSASLVLPSIEFRATGGYFAGAFGCSVNRTLPHIEFEATAIALLPHRVAVGAPTRARDRVCCGDVAGIVGGFNRHDMRRNMLRVCRGGYFSG